MIAGTVCGDSRILDNILLLLSFLSVYEFIFAIRKHMLYKSFFFSLNVNSCKHIDVVRPERWLPCISKDYFVIIFQSDKMRRVVIRQFVHVHTAASVHQFYFMPFLMKENDLDKTFFTQHAPPFVLLFVSRFLYIFKYKLTVLIFFDFCAIIYLMIFNQNING